MKKGKTDEPLRRKETPRLTMSLKEKLYLTLLLLGMLFIAIPCMFILAAWDAFCWLESYWIERRCHAQ